MAPAAPARTPSPSASAVLDTVRSAGTTRYWAWASPGPHTSVNAMNRTPTFMRPWLDHPLVAELESLTDLPVPHAGALGGAALVLQSELVPQPRVAPVADGATTFPLTSELSSLAQTDSAPPSATP